MIINCKSCDTSYDIKEDLVAPNGSKVRCSNCEDVFVVYPAATAGNRMEKSNEALEVTEHEETTVFENKIEGIIDDFDIEQSFEDPEREIGLQYLEKTAIIDFQEIEDPDGAAPGHDDGEDLTENPGFSNESVFFEETDFGLETMPEAELEIDGDLGDFDPDLKETDKQAADAQSKTGSEPIISPEADILEDFELDLEDEYDTDGREYEVDLIEEHEPVEEIGAEEFGFDLGEDEPFNAKTEAKDELAVNDFAVELDFEAEAEETVIDNSEETLSDVDYHQATLDFDFDLDGIEGADDASPQSAVEDDDFELDFDLDLDLDGEAKASVEENIATSVPEDGFDLTDVEEFLDLEKELGQQYDQGSKQSFSLGLETKRTDASGKAGNEEAYDFELATQKNETAFPEGETLNNISLATALEPGGGQGFGKEKKDGKTHDETVHIGVETSNAGEVIGRKRSRSVLKTALFVSLFIAIAGGGYFYMLETQPPVPPETTRIAVPEPAPALTQAPVDSNGNLQIAISRPDYSFIANEKIGEIMVIRGSVTNHYDHARKDIQVRGNVYDEAGELLFSSAPVYAGVMVDTDDLLTRVPAEIEKGLTSGSESADTLIDNNQSVPFMIVFSQLPSALGQLSVEVVASRSVNE